MRIQLPVKVDNIIKTLEAAGYEAFAAVSYTHLDVYKRQVYWIPNAFANPSPKLWLVPDCSAFPSCINADVYKRQIARTSFPRLSDFASASSKEVPLIP